MLTIHWEKIDKFYLILTLVLIAMSVLLIFSFRGVFSLFLTSNEFNPEALAPPTRVNREKLQEASNWAFQKPIEPLNSGL